MPMAKTGRRRPRSKGRVDDDVDLNSNVDNEATNIDTRRESKWKRRRNREAEVLEMKRSGVQCGRKLDMYQNKGSLVLKCEENVSVSYLTWVATWSWRT